MDRRTERDLSPTSAATGKATAAPLLLQLAEEIDLLANLLRWIAAGLIGTAGCAASTRPPLRARTAAAT